MGWYLRKRVKLAPFVNLNLSRSGAGVSVGPRGFKLSISPKGNVQLNAGRDGLYYRKNLGQLHSSAPTAPPASIAAPAPFVPSPMTSFPPVVPPARFASPAPIALPAAAYCSRCGNLVSPGANYCGHCGARI